MAHNARSSLSVSARRHFVDGFFFSQAYLIKGHVIDIGGKKARKRGLFDIEKTGAVVTYVNIEPRDEPDILADAASIPLPDETFDVAIMGELLEHVPDSLAALKEAKRLLKPGGLLLATVPFMVGVHGDPYDFARYTRAFYEKVAKDLDFAGVEIEEQGSIFAVAALMLQHLFLAFGKSWRPIQIPLVSLLMWLDRRTQKPALRAWTTGYGIILRK